MIAEKYGGSLNTRAEDNVFYLNILIPMEDKVVDSISGGIVLNELAFLDELPL